MARWCEDFSKKYPALGLWKGKLDRLRKARAEESKAERKARFRKYAVIFRRN